MIGCGIRYEKTKHLAVLRWSDVHAAQVRFDHGERCGGNAVLLAADDGVVAHLVAFAYSQKLGPEEAPDLFRNGISQELQDRSVCAV